MAIADDFTINVAGDIRHSANTNHYTVLELHRWLGDIADDGAPATSDDIVDITSATPSARSTDSIIELLNGYNIDDDAAEYFYGGSIKQDGGDTLYSGLIVYGSVNTAASQIQIQQDGALYDGDSPFWGTQAAGGYNGNAAQSILMRILVKSRESGYDINQKKIRVRLAHYLDSYAFFDTILGEGESVAAVSSVNDPQNDTAVGTVDAYTHVTNTEGFQTIDINDGNGAQPYYSKWTYGADTSGDQLKAVWEWGKATQRVGTAKTIHGIDGELFYGPSHSYVYDNLSGTFTEDEKVVWGTSVTYGSLAGGTFTEGYYCTIGSNGAAGRIAYDNGTTTMRFIPEDGGTIALVASDTITEYNPSTGVASGVTASVSGTPTMEAGGEGLLLASDTSGLKHHIQLVHGTAPINNQEIRGLSSNATCDVDTTITARTVYPVYLGSYVGTLIGAYGIGIDADDLTSSDSVIDLDGDTNTPPNNQTWTLGGIISGDRCLVGPGTGSTFEWDQYTLNTTLNASGQTSVVITASIDSWIPQTGWLRVELDDGRIRSVAYTSWTGSTFTTGSTDWTDPLDATAGNNVMVAMIDKAATGTSETFAGVYTPGPYALWVRVRNGSTPGSEIKTYEAASSFTATGGGATASRIDDF